MKNLLTPSRTLAVPLLMGYWTCAVAQSLGNPAADLWIGQPLELSVPARFAPNEADDSCVRAEVFYGDQRVDGVRATVLGTDANRHVRVQADRPIDEPVVTVSLRAGCRNYVTRKYSLLPEIPSEAVLAALMRPQAPPMLAAATAAATGVPLRLATAAAPAPASRGLRRAVKASAGTSVADAAPPARHLSHALRKSAPTHGARLQLDPVEPDPRAFLRVSSTLAEPQGDAARRATAALMWQAINADPQDVLRTSAMLKQLEGEMAQLRHNAGDTRREMTELRRRLDEAQPWYASPLAIQLLGALVLAAAAAAGSLWFRTRRLELARGPWYAPATEPVLEPMPATAASAPATAASAPARPAAAVAPLRAQPVAVPAVQPAAAPASRPAPARQPMPMPVMAAADAAPAAAASAAPGPIDFTLPEAPRRSATGMLRVETLAATLEEVEFLSSLGLSLDAMEVLKTYLHDSSNPSPLAYFELMRLCDQDEDPAAVTSVRRRYAQAFGMEAPTLQQVTAARGLESTSGLSERITRAWDSVEVLDLIEEALFTVPPPAAALTLQAGRDLICLHDLAMALVTEGSTSDGADVESLPLAPWAHAEDSAAAHAATQAAADADGGHHFALDVDLSAAPEPLPDRQPQAHEAEPEVELELAPLIAEMQAAAEREASARARAEAEDAFSAAVALERVR